MLKINDNRKEFQFENLEIGDVFWADDLGVCMKILNVRADDWTDDDAPIYDFISLKDGWLGQSIAFQNIKPVNCTLNIESVGGK